jgi:hypothetical protein
MLMSVLRYAWKVTLPYVAFPALMNSAMTVWMEATLRKMKTKVTLQLRQVLPKQEPVRKLLNHSFMHTPLARVTNRKF